MTPQDDRAPVILIVEDHPSTLDLVRQYLSAAFPACFVLGADSGELALEECVRHAPHVVIMDISLPGIDGIEATRRVKALCPGTHVVMHSTHDLPIYRDAAAAAGAAAFVSKSNSGSELVPAIAGLIQS